jgi:hypothetical protein
LRADSGRKISNVFNAHACFFDDLVPSELRLPSAVMRVALQTSFATYNAVSRIAAPSAMIELAASVN